MYAIIQGSFVEKHTMRITTENASLFTTHKQAEDVAKQLAIKTKQSYYVVNVLACVGTETKLVKEKM